MAVPLRGKDAPALPVAPSRQLLLAAAGLAVLALLIDYVRYFAGYHSGMAALREAEASNAKEVTYSYSSFPYRLRTVSFWAKQVVAVLAVAMVGYEIVRCLLA